MKHKKLIIAIGVVITIAFALLFGASSFFLHYALARPAVPYEIEKEFCELKADYPWTAQWVDSIRTTGALRDTIIHNPEGLKMHAWYLPSADSTAGTAVIVHGYTSNPIEMMQIGYLYNHDLGYNILLPDLIAHGQSEGETIQMGWFDRLAVQQWIGVAHNIFRTDTMVVHGISMGAATTMCVAGDETPEYVRAFVEDCGYTSVWEEFGGELQGQFSLQAFPLLHTTSWLCKLRHGWSFTEANPLKQVARCSKPMLFIHGTADTYVPTAMVHPLYAAKPEPKQLWLAPGSAHAVAYKDHPQEYTETVRKFLEKAF